MKQFIQIKNEIRKISYLLYQHNKITKEVYKNLLKSLNGGKYNDGRKYDCNKRPQNFLF